MSNPSVVVAEVVLPLPLDQAYSYRVPDDLTDGAVAGARVLVPFGPRRLTGLVTALRETDAEEGAALKPILDVLDETPSFTKEMLRLTKWMADYYVCGWGEVVKAALPTGTDVATEHRLARTDAPAGDWQAHPKARAVLRYLDAHADATVSGLRQQVKDVPLALLRRLERDGVGAPDLTIGHALITPEVWLPFGLHDQFNSAIADAETERTTLDNPRRHSDLPDYVYMPCYLGWGQATRLALTSSNTGSAT